MSNPHQVTKDFEAALCAYTGARFAVTTTSCTMAIQIAAAWWRHHHLPYPHCYVGLPKRTYVGVPAAILNAGCQFIFTDEEWRGEYQLGPSPVWDSARRFTSGMFRPGSMQCISFHATKILADSQGGAILHDNDEADAWLRRARFDGRTEGADPKTDQVQYPSWHAYLSPDVAARLLWKLHGLPRHNDDLPNSDYPDLSLLGAFK
jgi:dTDP-4-amino-4,6-dideoxygalactose transaminase